MNAVEMKEYGYRFWNATSPDTFDDPDDAPVFLVAPDGEEVTKVQAEQEITSGYWRERHLNASENELFHKKQINIQVSDMWWEIHQSYIELMQQSTRYYQVLILDEHLIRRFDIDPEKRGPFYEFEGVEYSPRDVKYLCNGYNNDHVIYKVSEIETPKGLVLLFTRS